MIYLQYIHDNIVYIVTSMVFDETDHLNICVSAEFW